MQRFFPDFACLDRFSLSLDCLGDTVQCPHCCQSHQLVSHGVIYQQRSIDEREAVGKRLFCSNRYRRTGCGRTVQLYVAQQIPSMRYRAAQLFSFLCALLANATVQAAYQGATGQSATRHAWRWLRRLELKLSDFRCFVRPPVQYAGDASNARSRRLKLLLPTVKQIFSQLPHCPCAHYQLACQRALI